MSEKQLLLDCASLRANMKEVREIEVSYEFLSFYRKPVTKIMLHATNAVLAINRVRDELTRFELASRATRPCPLIGLPGLEE